MEKNHLQQVKYLIEEEAHHEIPPLIGSKLLEAEIDEETEFVGVSANCIHLTQNHYSGRDFVELTGDETGMYVALERRLETYKGQTMFSPISRFGTAAGFSVWQIGIEDLHGDWVNEEFLYIYFAASSMMNIE